VQREREARLIGRRGASVDTRGRGSKRRRDEREREVRLWVLGGRARGGLQRLKAEG
jgi:hypothetical protein